MANNASLVAFSSSVVGVPYYVVAPKLKDVEGIKKYALDRAISCCIVENGLLSTAVGCVRRCNLYPVDQTRRKSPIEDPRDKYGPDLLREQLISVHQDNYGVEVVLDYIPCDLTEAHRSVFGTDGHQYLKSARTTYTATSVSHNSNQCFLSARTTIELYDVKTVPIADFKKRFDCEEPLDFGGDMRQKEAEERAVAVNHIFRVWQTFLDRVIHSLETCLLTDAYILLGSNADKELKDAFDAFENMYCKWEASTAASLSRQSVLKTMQEALHYWEQTLRELKNQKALAFTAQNDVEGARLTSAETAKQLVEQKNALDELLAQQAKFTPVPLQDVASEGAKMASKNPTQLALSDTRVPFLNSTYRYSSEVLFGSANPSLAVNNGSCAALTDEATTHVPVNNDSLPSLFARLFDPQGQLDEKVARSMFLALGPRTLPLGKNSASTVEPDELDCYLTLDEMAELLFTLDSTLRNLEEERAQKVQRQHTLRPADATLPRAQVSAATTDKTCCHGGFGNFTASEVAAPITTDALEKMVERHNCLTEERREKTLRARAADAVSRYAFRETKRLYFDEFCLALLHLLKV